MIVLLILFILVAIGAFFYGFRHGDSCDKPPRQAPTQKSIGESIEELTEEPIGEPTEEDTGEFTQEELDYWYLQQQEEEEC